MAYIGLVPSERSTGSTVRRGGITKVGNTRLRALMVESAWTYRHPPRVGARKLYRLEKTTPKVRELAWKAQVRLTARYRALSARGKKSTVVCAAIARELTGFMGPSGERLRWPDPPSLSSEDIYRASVEAWPRQGNSRTALCGRHCRRPQ